MKGAAPRTRGDDHDPAADAIDRTAVAGDGIAPIRSPEPLPAPVSLSSLQDDRQAIEPGDRVVLIIEDESSFAKILLDMAREKGLQGTRRPRWRRRSRDGARLPSRCDHARHRHAGHGRMEACSIDSSAIPTTRHIPVHIITRHATSDNRGSRRGRSPIWKSPSSKEALEDSFNRIESVHRPASETLARRGGRRRRSEEHRRAHRTTKTSRSRPSRRQRKRSRSLTKDALRLHGARPRSRRRHRRVRAAGDG